MYINNKKEEKKIDESFIFIWLFRFVKWNLCPHKNRLINTYVIYLREKKFLSFQFKKNYNPTFRYIKMFPQKHKKKAFIPFNVESHCVLQSWFGKFTFNPLFLVRLQMRSLPLYLSKHAFIYNIYTTQKYYVFKTIYKKDIFVCPAKCKFSLFYTNINSKPPLSSSYSHIYDVMNVMEVILVGKVGRIGKLIKSS